MAREKKRFSIDTDQYECEQLPSRRGFELYNKLVKVLMPALRELSKASAGDDRDETVFTLIATAIEAMPLDLSMELADTFAEHCKVKNGELWLPLQGEVFEQHFAGRYPHMTRWLFACLRTNYQDFLGGFTGSGRPAAAAE